MLKNQVIFILIILLILMNGCDDSETDQDQNITAINLSLSKTRIVGDAVDAAAVTILDQNLRTITREVAIYYNGKVFPGKNISSSIPGRDFVYAIYKNIKSNEVELEVVEDKNLKFEKNILMEQYTATWCGWCPRAVDQISTLEKAGKKIIHAAYHLNDEMTWSLNMSLFQSFGFTGIPTVHADRKIVYSGQVSSIDGFPKSSRVGISLTVAGTRERIWTTVTLKFGYGFTDELDLSVYLLHDSLIANQSNYYNNDSSSPFYNKGNPIINFVHRNTMIQSCSTLYGEIIPTSSIDIGSIYTRTYSQIPYRCDDIRKLVIIAFVSYNSGTQSGQVLNSAKARVGEETGFVYVDN